ncbi:hypothetical protein NBRC116187_16190 [Halopseudomonas sabulinigri]|uniref:Uncharacterized protein n=1 Tax=Halopseudomonas sabulinigri TaxID=472181 RepID=A0ABP9ZP73_9GAMM
MRKAADYSPFAGAGEPHADRFGNNLRNYPTDCLFQLFAGNYSGQFVALAASNGTLGYAGHT